MKTTSINRVIDDFNSLVLEEKEYALTLIRKMLADAQREALLIRAHSAEKNYKKGTTKQGTAKDLHNDLEND